MTSDAAARSIRAKLIRAATELPTSEPNRGCSESWSFVFSPENSNRSCIRPSLSRLPFLTAASLISTPSRSVPLRLPRSLAQTPFSSTTSSQWKRETVRSSSSTSLSGWLPMEVRSPVDSKVCPAPGPSTTRSRNRRTSGTRLGRLTP